MHSKELPRSHGVLPDNLLTLPCYIIYLKDLASLGCMRSLHLRNRGSITVNHVINVPPSFDQNELLENNWRITKFEGLFFISLTKNEFIHNLKNSTYIYTVWTGKITERSISFFQPSFQIIFYLFEIFIATLIRPLDIHHQSN